MFVLNSVAKCKLPTAKQFISFNVETFTVCVSGKFVHWTYGLIKYKQKSDVYSSKCHKLLRNNIKCIFKMYCTWNAIALFYLNIQLIWFLSNWFGLCKYRVTNLLQLHFELKAHKKKPTKQHGCFGTLPRRLNMSQSKLVWFGWLNEGNILDDVINDKRKKSYARRVLILLVYADFDTFTQSLENSLRRENTEKVHVN